MPTAVPHDFVRVLPSGEGLDHYKSCSTVARRASALPRTGYMVSIIEGRRKIALRHVTFNKFNSPKAKTPNLCSREGRYLTRALDRRDIQLLQVSPIRGCEKFYILNLIKHNQTSRIASKPLCNSCSSPMSIC